MKTKFMQIKSKNGETQLLQFKHICGNHTHSNNNLGIHRVIIYFVLCLLT